MKPQDERTHGQPRFSSLHERLLCKTRGQDDISRAIMLTATHKGALELCPSGKNACTLGHCDPMWPLQCFSTAWQCMQGPLSKGKAVH